jgi:hypothetical protein
MFLSFVPSSVLRSKSFSTSGAMEDRNGSVNGRCFVLKKNPLGLLSETAPQITIPILSGPQLLLRMQLEAIHLLELMQSLFRLVSRKKVCFIVCFFRTVNLQWLSIYQGEGNPGFALDACQKVIEGGHAKRLFAVSFAGVGDMLP